MDGGCFWYERVMGFISQHPSGIYRTYCGTHKISWTRNDLPAMLGQIIPARSGMQVNQENHPENRQTHVILMLVKFPQKILSYRVPSLANLWRNPLPNLENPIWGSNWVCLKIVYPSTQWFCWSLSLLFMAISLGVYPIFRHTQIHSLKSSLKSRDLLVESLQIPWNVALIHKTHQVMASIPGVSPPRVPGVS